MKQFSHSKLQVYERCPLQYKLKYLSDIKVKRENTVEAFMGSCVHSTLELLYDDLLKTKLNTLKDLLAFYHETWKNNWDDEIKINNKKFDKKHYYNLGKKCIQNYYEKYHPFDQDQTIGIENKISLKWGAYEVMGYIDRLSREKKGVYAIHDYKTGKMMEQEYADKDRQLALYAMAVKERFKEAKTVKLIWHYVAFGEDIISQRSNEELKKLKKDILELIKEINQAEKDDNFPAKETMCDWCSFWEYCPKKKHLFKIKKLPKNEYLKESGIKLDDKYIELSEKKSKINKKAKTEVEDIQNEIKKVEEALLKYAEKNNIETVQGDKARVLINKKSVYIFPNKTSGLENYIKLEKLLKETKYWKMISVVNSGKLEELLEKDIFDKGLKKKIIALAPKEETIKISIKKNNEK